MSQNDVVGVLRNVELLASAQPGLHYARHVLFADKRAGDALPPVGRGKAIAAADGWRAHVGRSTVITGNAEYVLGQLVDLRNAVVVVVKSDDIDAVQPRLEQLAATREVHLVPLTHTAIRIIVSDAAQVVVQAFGEDGWVTQPLLVQASEPQTRRTRNGKTTSAHVAVSTSIEAPSAEAASDITEPVSVDDSKLAEPPSEIVVNDEALPVDADATVVDEPTQSDQTPDTEKAEQAEEN